MATDADLWEPGLLVGRAKAGGECKNRSVNVDADLSIRAGALQALLVVILALTLALIFPDGFFRTWGWLSGPLAWMVCATVVAWRLTLPRFATLMGAAVAGLPSLLAVAIGLHWAGALIGVIVFAVWCGTLHPRRPRHTHRRLQT